MKKTNNTIEKRLLHLEEIVQKLESKETSLQDSIDLFKEASELIVECREIVSKANLQIETISDMLKKDK
ncbi:MAG: exodeoxyribonuclease VII small subunit [Candidatus Kapabacteria bacterium]|nr:exodeoxyribonuclease VII small subunit [Candidatus Kapabacteria bacterium]